jgi:hypothetical protein
MMVHLTTQSESKQNTLVLWGIVGFLAIVLCGVGIAIGEGMLIVAPPGVALTAAFVWLVFRYQRRWAKARAARAAKEIARKEPTAPRPEPPKAPPG